MQKFDEIGARFHGGDGRKTNRFPLFMEESGSVSSVSEESVLNYYCPFQQREEADLFAQFRSLYIDKEIDVSPPNTSGIWSQSGNDGLSDSRRSLLMHTPLFLSDHERSSSFSSQTYRHPMPSWLRPCSEPWSFLNDHRPLFLAKNDPIEDSRTWSFDDYDHPGRSFRSNGRNLMSLSSAANPPSMDGISVEDSFILQGKLYTAGRTGYGLYGGQRKTASKDGIFNLPFTVQRFQSLAEIRGFINLVARDQQGCRFLQHKFDEGTRQEREMIFNEIIDHVPELMVNPFGNYLVQKVLEVCTEDQRLEIVIVLTKNPTELVRISLNMHGTRAVQKLIESLKVRRQIALVISALQPGFLSLIKDPNGNHVIQRCLQHFSPEDSKFIFEAAARHCVEIATHRHGCCVLQRCIAHSSGAHQARLLGEVAAHGLALAQDAYGNYAVQFVLEMREEGATEGLKGRFSGRYAELARQKFSSNVVEKCLSVFEEGARRGIVAELLAVPCFDQLLQDPYANYVIQSALLTSKGSSRSALVEAIRAHEGVLRTSPYCKRIFTLVGKK
ncbi:putative pumilio homolog 8, chloroplastic [Wolffia australiana]